MNVLLVLWVGGIHQKLTKRKRVFPIDQRRFYILVFASTVIWQRIRIEKTEGSPILIPLLYRVWKLKCKEIHTTLKWFRSSGRKLTMVICYQYRGGYSWVAVSARFRQRVYLGHSRLTYLTASSSFKDDSKRPRSAIFKNGAHRITDATKRPSCSYIAKAVRISVQFGIQETR